MSELTNREIAAAFDELGDLYELDGAIVHRVVAYRSAAKAVRDATSSVAALARAGRATELPGIGRTLADKISALLETGSIPSLERLRAKYPAGVVDMMRLPGLGPKRARRLYEELGVDSFGSLREAAANERIRTLRGFGPKAEQTIAAALERQTERPATRVLLPRALELGELIVGRLRAEPAAVHVELAGSARRLSDTVKDLDIVATTHEPAALARALAELDVVESVQSAGEAGARVTTHNGMRVDLKIVAPDQLGNALQHFTGSQAHNVALREAAVRRGLHVSEYGIADDATGVTHRCASEAEVYELLGLRYIEPELREGRGELEAAAGRAGGLPQLIELADLRGDLHCHTKASDGRGTVEQMARAALERGYGYLAITDHSASHGFGNGVSPDQLWRSIEHIRAVDDGLEGIRVLAGSEVNILLDGSPDYDDDLLAELDWVVASVHSSFAMEQPAMTERMLAAIEHPLIDAIGHPTGRKIQRRAGYALDLERIFAAAAHTGTALEINGAPDRRDLSDINARAAAQAGVRIVIDSDAHGPERLELIGYGVATARRAWLTREQVINTREWEDLAASRKRMRG